jgi:hypothetical protein
MTEKPVILNYRRRESSGSARAWNVRKLIRALVLVSLVILAAGYLAWVVWHNGHERTKFY